MELTENYEHQLVDIQNKCIENDNIQSLCAYCHEMKSKYLQLLTEIEIINFENERLCCDLQQAKYKKENEASTACKYLIHEESSKTNDEMNELPSPTKICPDKEPDEGENSTTGCGHLNKYLQTLKIDYKIIKEQYSQLYKEMEIISQENERLNLKLLSEFDNESELSYSKILELSLLEKDGEIEYLRSQIQLMRNTTQDPHSDDRETEFNNVLQKTNQNTSKEVPAEKQKEFHFIENMFYEELQKLRYQIQQNDEEIKGIILHDSKSQSTEIKYLILTEAYRKLQHSHEKTVKKESILKMSDNKKAEKLKKIKKENECIINSCEHVNATDIHLQEKSHHNWYKIRSEFKGITKLINERQNLLNEEDIIDFKTEEDENRCKVGQNEIFLLQTKDIVPSFLNNQREVFTEMLLTDQTRKRPNSKHIRQLPSYKSVFTAKQFHNEQMEAENELQKNFCSLKEQKLTNQNENCTNDRCTTKIQVLQDLVKKITKESQRPKK